MRILQGEHMYNVHICPVCNLIQLMNIFLVLPSIHFIEHPLFEECKYIAHSLLLLLMFGIQNPYFGRNSRTFAV